VIIPGLRRARPSLWLPLLAVLLAGCQQGGRLPGEPDPKDRPVPADKELRFEVLFRDNCAGCHGAEGKMGPAPPLNDRLFLAIADNEDLVRVIRDGRLVTRDQPSPMPAFGQGEGAPLSKGVAFRATLTREQIDALAEGLKKKWGEPAPPSEIWRRYREPEKPGDAKKGQDVFDRACSGCHGEHGEGGELDSGRKIGPINDPTFLALISNQALRRYVITGRPDLGMPSYNGKEGRGSKFEPLTSQEIADVVALLAAWRKGASIGDK
jgi:mono/diheme cytochrome c family protein